MFRALALAPLLVLALVAPAAAQTQPWPSPTPSGPLPPPVPRTNYCELAPDRGVYTLSNRPVDIGVRLVVRNPDPATATATVTARQITVTRNNPQPVGLVRQTAPGTYSSVTFSVAPPVETGLTITATGVQGCPDGATDLQANTGIQVTAAISIAARRNAGRDYTFTGRVSPGRGQRVSLYRVQSNGERVLTARTTVRQDGTYRIDRRFTGSGRFGFVAVVPEVVTVAYGNESAVRPTLIY